MSVVAHERVNTDRAMRLSGATRRQLDHWVRCGYLHPDNARLGTGRPLMWPPDQIAIAWRIVRLLNLGFLLHAAVSLALHPGELRKTAQALTEVDDGDV